LMLDSAGPLSLGEVAPPHHEGGTDLQMLDGCAGFAGIPGHEFVGVVVDATAADRAWIGQRVVGEINVGCGACAWCARGLKEYCPIARCSASAVVTARLQHKLKIASDVGLDAHPGNGRRNERFDVVVDATGRPAGLARAIELVEPRPLFRGKAASRRAPSAEGRPPRASAALGA